MLLEQSCEHCGRRFYKHIKDESLDTCRILYESRRDMFDLCELCYIELIEEQYYSMALI